jgi:hypothetical protein
MNKNQVIEAFNNHFIEFISDVERVFPNDTDITLARKTMSKTFVLLPKLLIRMFHEYFVLVYSKEIDAGDLNFFVENDYRNKHGYKEDEEAWVLEKIDCLRGPVRNMTEEEKLKVIRYLQNLKKLSELYTSLKKCNIKK